MAIVSKVREPTIEAKENDVLQNYAQTLLYNAKTVILFNLSL